LKNTDQKNYTIVTFPNKELFKPTQKVGFFGDDLVKQVEVMTEALRKEGGIGLAANQIGVENRVLVTEFNDPDNKDSIPFHALINPEIVEYGEETDCVDEGCLSIPPIELPVDRFTKVKTKAQNIEGKKIKLTAKGLFARVLQHEIDHLNGILFTDRVKEKYLSKHPFLKNAKIVFIGSGEFASTILKGLLSLDLNIKLIITESPKPAGRNGELRQTPVAAITEQTKVKLIQTDGIAQNTQEIQAIEPDLIILSDFGQIIPENILSLAKTAAINLHPSLLPKYRGATPIQTAILNGDKETGVSLMVMTPELDKGPVLAQIKTEIYNEENALELEKRLSVMAMKMLYEVLPALIELKLKPIELEGTNASFTKKFKKEDGLIDWDKPAEEIDRQIRAFFPWPGTYTFINDKILKIHQAHLEEGKLVLDVVQPEGKNAMSFKDFLRGFHGTKPDWFNKIS